MQTDTLAELSAQSITTETDASPIVYQSDDWPVIFGLRLAPFTFEQTLAEADRLIQARRPAYFITANLHYASLVARDRRLQQHNEEAAFLVADGMPLVWASRIKGAPLPERVAGSDLTPALCQRAAERGYRVYLFGAQPQVAQRAADVLRRQCYGLTIAGVHSPSPAELDPSRDAETTARIREARPDLLFIALSQPKGEHWLLRNYRTLGPMLTVQVGASLDFIAGEVLRAPRWMQRTGLEWLYRMVKEPLRLGPRYARDIEFLTRTVIGRPPRMGSVSQQAAGR